MNHTCNSIILIAEDDLDDQELLAYAFAQVDPSLKLDFVNDGKEALDYLRSASESGLPCVIMLDYNMPEYNGAQVIRHLHPNKRYQSIPKVILSTSSNPLFMRECMDHGAHDYKVKPDDFQQLLGIAREMAALCKSAA